MIISLRVSMLQLQCPGLYVTEPIAIEVSLSVVQSVLVYVLWARGYLAMWRDDLCKKSGGDWMQKWQTGSPLERLKSSNGL